MKKKNLSWILFILLGVILIGVGIGIDYKKVPEKDPLENKKGNIYGDEYHEDYKELGPQSLKEEQIFDNIKYTENHLSSTSNEYATFTSIIFNKTGTKITKQKIEIDFYDTENNLIATMPSVIENLDSEASTIIFAVVEKDLTKANTFKVRQVQ